MFDLPDAPDIERTMRTGYPYPSSATFALTAEALPRSMEIHTVICAYRAH